MDNPTVKSLYALASERLSHVEVMDRIRESVHRALAERGIEVPPDALILYDDVYGRVVITHGEYVWGGEAAFIAIGAAESTLKQLAESKQRYSLPLWHDASSLLRSSPLARGLFWFFNGVVILYWCAWFVRFIFSHDFRVWYETTRTSGSMGILGMFLFLLLPAIPLAVTTYQLLSSYLQTDKKSSYGRSFMLFEVPALVSTFLANILLATAPLTPGLRIFFGVLFIALLVYWFFAIHQIRPKSNKTQILYLLASVTALTVFVYVSLLTIVFFYISGIEEVALSIFLDFESIGGEILRDPMIALTLLVGLIFSLLPAFIYLFIMRWGVHTIKDIFIEYEGRNPRTARTVLYGTPCLFIALLLVLSVQPSISEYEQDLVLVAQEDPVYESQLSRAAKLTDKKDKVDKALERGLYASRMYAFQRSDFDDPWRSSIANAYLRIVAFPFIYDDSDGGISFTEHETIVTGYELVYGIPFGHDPEESIAPIKQVQLLDRDIHVQTHGNPLLAEVTVTDSLGTFTSLDQEVVYEFSLPEHAAITGLRLGTALEHVGQIAPRGAAQEVYTNEVRAMRDPALLEQTGPRQYRLRVYPVPGTSQEAKDRRREEVAGMTQRVQFSYVVLRDEKGVPMPLYTEEYNLLTGETEVTVNIDGKTAQLTDSGAFVMDPKDATRLCDSTAGMTTQLGSGKQVRLIVGVAPDGSSLPYCNPSLGSSANLSNVQNKSILFLIDTSYSEREDILSPQLDVLNSLPSNFFTQNTVEYRLFSNQPGVVHRISEPNSVPQADGLVYYGRGDVLNALGNVGSQYDVVVIVTGSNDAFLEQSFDNWTFNSNQQAESQVLTNLYNTNVVFWHSREDVPSFPPLVTNKLLSAKTVSITSDIVNKLSQIAMNEAYGGTLQLSGPFWHIAAYSPGYQPTTGIDGQTTDTWSATALQAVSERQRISIESRPLLASALAYQYSSALDSLHNDALRLGIVTPLSSYIALVNQEQQQRLDNLTGRVDKYTSSQRFGVTQPQLMNPLGGSFGARSRGFSTTLSIQSGSAVPMAPTSMPGGGGSFNESPDSSMEDMPNDDIGMLPRILVLALTLVLFVGSIGFVVWRTIRKHRS